jgi:hypothetical protein
MLVNLSDYSILELSYGLVFIILLFYFTKSYNINLLQFLLVTSIVLIIIYISIIKKEDLKNLKNRVNIQNTNNKSILEFVDNIKYFKLYNPPLYSSFMNKIDNYIKLQKFINIHQKEGYKLYPKEILDGNLKTQKQDTLETFITFEHSLDDRITSTYELNDLYKTLKNILNTSNLTI